jgi:hypothetical protein
MQARNPWRKHSGPEKEGAILVDYSPRPGKKETGSSGRLMRNPDVVFDEAHFAVLLAAFAANSAANAFQTGRAGSGSLLSRLITPKRRNVKLSSSRLTMPELFRLFDRLFDHAKKERTGVKLMRPLTFCRCGSRCRLWSTPGKSAQGPALRCRAADATVPPEPCQQELFRYEIADCWIIGTLKLKGNSTSLMCAESTSLSAYDSNRCCKRM